MERSDKFSLKANENLKRIQSSEPLDDQDLECNIIYIIL